MINVTKPYLGDKERFKAYIDKIYANNWITNQGPLHAQLEERLRDYLGVRNIILVNNGTLALQVAYRALGLTGSAITTPFSFVATTSTLLFVVKNVLQLALARRPRALVRRAGRPRGGDPRRRGRCRRPQGRRADPDRSRIPGHPGGQR